jgi:hypothetical protein
MTYIDTHARENASGGGYDDHEHEWRRFTERRLTWLYGPNHKAERATASAKDVASWNALGEPKGGRAA